MSLQLYVHVCKHLQLRAVITEGGSYVQVACIQLHLLLQLREQLVVEGLELQDREKGRVQRGQMVARCRFGLGSLPRVQCRRPLLTGRGDVNRISL